jgi:hypothetical protein
MKKIFLIGAIALSCAFAKNVFGQETEFSLTNEKKELRHEKREVNAEERAVRKEEKATRYPEVSYMTKEQFKTDFPEAKDPVFTVGQNFEEASYLLNGRQFIAYYDADSKRVGTTTEKQMGDLPLRAQKTINGKYASEGYSVDKVILFDDDETNTADMFMYNQQFNDEDIYFVELKKAEKTLIVQVNMDGSVSFFKNI